ncbi:MAG: SurA N-terminal domain-containing protein [Candidatus Woesearchaeota archaeon]|nr:SurA N-terminal domain-containing protein [Candidatus Woesearchaeota archaeon]
MEETENMGADDENKSKEVHRKETRTKAHKRVKVKAKAAKSEQKDEGISKIRIGIAVAILIVLVLVIIFYNNIFPSNGGVVAVVNGEKITGKEFNALEMRYGYSLYKEQGLTEMEFLNSTVIPLKLLLQEAGKQGITVSGNETEDMITNVIEMSGMTREDLDSQLKQQNMTYEDFKQTSKEGLIITKLLNATIPAMGVTEQDAKDFYNSNKDLFKSNTTFIKFDEVKAKIITYLANKKFMEQIRNNAEVQIFLTEGSELPSAGSSLSSPDSSQKQGSFSVSSEDICMENGKPLVMLFSTTTCPHCNWIRKTFDSVAKEYADAGKIAAYHWELDTGDNTLTAAKESKIPDDYANMFWKYSQQGGVPAFIFGCKYYRIGNAYENSNDLASEERDFRKMMDSLIAG